LNCKVDELNVYPEYNIPFNLIARRAKKEVSDLTKIGRLEWI